MNFQDIPLRVELFSRESPQTSQVCISYLAESDQLSPLSHRRALLKDTWGFLCRCERCLGGRPLDRRLEAVDWEGLERRSALASVTKAFRSLFDATFEDYDPPKEFETTLERLNNFRREFSFLDKAHVFSQRVRRELIAAFLLTGFDSEIAQRCAGPALSLLVEEMHVQHALLPSLSPFKVTPYVQFLHLLRHVPEKEARWHVSDLKVDGCELQHQQSLWLHDQPAAQRLQLAQPRNLPPAPLRGAPLRTGPLAKPGAACGCCASAPGPSLERCHGRSKGWPRSCRRKAQADEMPPLMENGPETPEVLGSSRSSTLWEAYAEFGRPSKDAQSLRRAGKVREPKGKDSWFKFRVARWYHEEMASHFDDCTSVKSALSGVFGEIGYLLILTNPCWGNSWRNAWDGRVQHREYSCLVGFHPRHGSHGFDFVLRRSCLETYSGHCPPSNTWSVANVTDLGIRSSTGWGRGLIMTSRELGITSTCRGYSSVQIPSPMLVSCL